MDEIQQQVDYGCTEAPDEFAVPDNSLLTYNLKRIDCIFIYHYPLQTLRRDMGKYSMLVPP